MCRNKTARFIYKIKGVKYMKRLIVLLMIIAGTTMYAERGERGDRDIRVDIYEKIQSENVERMSRDNTDKELDLEVQEVIKQRMEYNLFGRGQERD